MSIFERLLRLYKINTGAGKTPSEDFITELLTGLLQTDQLLLDSFVNEVLMIDGAKFKVSSQLYYSLPSDQNCIIDMVFENENSICFLENKVDSGEGDRQLERYSAVLNNINKEEEKNIYLRYCTKMYDPKNINDVPFLQFRWQRVYEFMKKQKESKIIESFLELLRSENMAGTSDFKVEDIIVLRGIWESITKMDEILDLVKPTFINFFGQPYQRDYERLKQIPPFNRYSLWTTKSIGKSQLEIMIGFDFEKTVERNDPSIFIRIYCDDRQIDDAVKGIFEPSKKIFNYYDNGNGELLALFEEPLINFLASKNQKEQLINWFVQKIEEVKIILNGIHL